MVATMPPRGHFVYAGILGTDGKRSGAKTLLVFNGQVSGIPEVQQCKEQSTMAKNPHMPWMNFKHTTEYIEGQNLICKKIYFPQLLMYLKFPKMQPYYKSVLFRTLLNRVTNSQCHLGT